MKYLITITAIIALAGGFVHWRDGKLQESHDFEIGQLEAKISDLQDDLREKGEEIRELKKELAAKPKVVTVEPEAPAQEEIPAGLSDEERQRRLDSNQAKYNQMLADIEKQAIGYQRHKKAAELDVKNIRSTLLTAENEYASYMARKNLGIPGKGISISRHEMEKRIGELRSQLTQAELRVDQIEGEMQALENRRAAMTRAFDTAQAAIRRAE